MNGRSGRRLKLTSVVYGIKKEEEQGRSWRFGERKIEESQMGLEYRGGGFWEVAVARRSLQVQPCTCQRGDFPSFSFLPFLRRMNYQSRYFR